MAELAPIILFVYNRPEHTEKVIDKLSKNRLAEQSDLFIFSDGPNTKLDEEKIKKTREIINRPRYNSTFKKITIIESKDNKGLANSVIEGVTSIMKDYGNVIVLEDDLLTSNSFLEYMNDALNYHKNDAKIWSISGFNLPINISAEYGEDTYLSYRASSWGWGTWNDRWAQVDWEVSDYPYFKKSLTKQRKFNRGGRDLTLMLNAQMKGKIDSWAIRWCYAQSKLDMLTVYPIKSLVRNIGVDGSGTHSNVTNEFNYLLDDAQSVRLSKIEKNETILKEFKGFYLSRTKYMFILMKRILFFSY